MAVYIYVSGWWTKPYWDRPATRILCDGSWLCDITTGGVDQLATRIAAFVLPAHHDPPLMSGGATLPQGLFENAVAQIEVERPPEATHRNSRPVAGPTYHEHLSDP